ncbi:uroporphyrinogen-III synthase [Gilvibacter sp.]|uniref:uroporphyrinogen-III synthase n=1 Tax=Gilvibacter sp. TaxID=2729997 RepID=UPI003F49DDF1
MRLLSTKILTDEQQARLQAAGYDVSHYDSLSIELLTFEIPEQAEHCIFSSQNAAKAFINNDSAIKQRSVYCVGEKAALLLEENGQKVIEIGQNAADLAQKIIKNHKNIPFYYFSGNLRRPEMPQLLAQNQVVFHEVPAYETRLNYPEFEQQFETVLFFSPTGVQSYHKNNNNTNYTAICIGETTRAEALAFTPHTATALHTTVDGVLDAALQHLEKA